MGLQAALKHPNRLTIGRLPPHRICDNSGRTHFCALGNDRSNQTNQCHNVLLLMGNAEAIAAIKQSLFLKPTSTKPILDFSLLLPSLLTLQQANFEDGTLKGEIVRLKGANMVLIGEMKEPLAPVANALQSRLQWDI